MSVAPRSYSRWLTAFILRSLARRILRRPLNVRPADVSLHADRAGVPDTGRPRTWNLTSRSPDRVDGPLERERILDWMRRSGISPELIAQAAQVLPDFLHPDRHDHLLAPFGFDRATRVQRITGDP